MQNHISMFSSCAVWSYSTIVAHDYCFSWAPLQSYVFHDFNLFSFVYFRSWRGLQHEQVVLDTSRPIIVNTPYWSYNDHCVSDLQIEFKKMTSQMRYILLHDNIILAISSNVLFDIIKESLSWLCWWYPWLKTQTNT